jgi:hypothetical protein
MAFRKDKAEFGALPRTLTEKPGVGSALAALPLCPAFPLGLEDCQAPGE